MSTRSPVRIDVAAADSKHYYLGKERMTGEAPARVLLWLFSTPWYGTHAALLAGSMSLADRMWLCLSRREGSSLPLLGLLLFP
jgi:hypothetical protein